MILLIGLSSILILFSSIINVHSQTCHNMNQYDLCSSNRGCSCLRLSFADNVGICALLGVSCARLNPCQPPYDTCEAPDHICVRHPQCDSRPLCYPLSMTDVRLCPAASSTMATATTTRSPETTMENTEATNFPGTMTDSSATYFETTEFPENHVTSYYSNILTSDSEQYPQSNKYYQAIQIMVYTTGTYSFTSSSSMDTFGYLYNGVFDPYHPTINQLTFDDDSDGNNQFKLSAYLQEGITYTLIFTTFGANETGLYSVIAIGPNHVQLKAINSIEATSIATMMTTMEFNSNSSIYSSVLSENSTVYFSSDNSTRQKYYEALQVIVKTTGFYTLASVSSIDTYGVLYEGDFIPSNPSLNIFQENDDSAGNGQFQLTVFLQPNYKYTLIVTTFGELVTGSYSIVASDADNLYVVPIN